MNKERRKLISENIRLLEKIKSNIEDILSDEEFSFDNMPENLQGSLRGEESQAAIDLLSEVIDALENSISLLQEIN